MNGDNLMNRINELTETYDSEHRKAVFFKKSQKIDRAEMISKTFQLNDLLEHNIYVMPNTNRIFIDYLYFKKYAYPEIYDKIVDRLFFVLDEMKSKYGNYEVFVNLDTITISAIERHKNIMKIFFDKCINDKLSYSEFLNKCVLYNVPNMFDIIKKFLFPFLMPRTRNMIELYNKEQTNYFMNAAASSSTS